MKNLKNTGAIASIFTAIIAAASLLPLYRSIRRSELSLKQTERSLRFGVYYQVLEMLEKTRQARHLLYTKLPQEPDNDSYSHLSHDEMEQLDELARTFDKLGLLVKHGVVPLEFVLDFYSYPIVLTWQRLAPYIKAERAKRHQQGHMAKFEMLALQAKNHRDMFHPNGESNELSEEWPVWSK